MKIAMLSEWRYPVFWWWQVHVEYLCKHLIQDFDCHIDLFTRKIKDTSGVIYGKNEIQLWGKWRIFRIWPVGQFFNNTIRIYHMIYFTIWFLYKARKEKYDIIHAHALLPGLPWKIVSTLLNIPIVYTVHGSMHLDSGNKNIYYYVEQYLITKVRYNHEILVSHNTLQYKNHNKNISVIHNWVDTQAFDNASTPAKDTWFTALTVWRIDRQKNHSSMIEALCTMDKDHLDAIWFRRKIIWDGILKNDLEKKVKEYGLEKYISFLGPIFWEDLIQEYKKAHIFVLPSFAEWQPLTILEAYAAELPVVATDVWDNKYIISHEKNGILMPVNDLRALRNALIYVTWLDKSRLHEWWKEWYTLIQEKYSWHQVVSKTHDIYKKVKKNW